MSTPTITEFARPPLAPVPTYVGVCCRAWVLAVFGPRGRCGLCDQVPSFLGDDPRSPAAPRPWPADE